MTAPAEELSIPPDSLLKFRAALPPESDPCLAWHEDLVRHSRLYLAKPSELNDPFDCSPSWVADATTALIERYKQALSKRRLEPLTPPERRAVRRVLPTRLRDAKFWRTSWLRQMDNHGVCALSQTIDEPLLWSHYSSGHRGYCVEIRLNDHVVESGDPSYLPVKVHYTDTRVEASVAAWLQAAICGVEDTDLGLKYLTRKDRRWSYEREWRLIERPGARSIQLPPNCVVGLVFGARCSRGDEATLRRWASARPTALTFKRAIADQRDYTISIVDA